MHYYIFRKRAEEKRAKIFRPPNVHEALDHRDYHIPHIEGGPGVPSRLLPVCASIDLIQREASPDVVRPPPPPPSRPLPAPHPVALPSRGGQCSCG